MGKVNVSVVVLNYNGAHLLPDCLESLLKQDCPDVEILVVDNASVDNSKDVVNHYAGIRWVGLPNNGGLGPGYNAGASAAFGDKLFFVNNDMRFESDCVSRLVGAFRDDRILAVDPLQMDWSGQQVIHGAQRFSVGWRHFNFGVPLMRPFQDLEAKKETEVPWGCAGSLMFDRGKFESLGGFDATFFQYYEDLDICWRGWLRGWKTLYVPEARLYHKVGESEDDRLRVNNPFFRSNPAPRMDKRRQLSQCKNAQRFILKTMPWTVVAASLLVGAAKTLGSLLIGRPRSGLCWLKATVLNIRESPEILRQRRMIRRQSVTTSLALMKRWGMQVDDGSAME